MLDNVAVLDTPLDRLARQPLPNSSGKKISRDIHDSIWRRRISA